MQIHSAFAEFYAYSDSDYDGEVMPTRSDLIAMNGFGLCLTCDYQVTTEFAVLCDSCYVSYEYPPLDGAFANSTMTLAEMTAFDEACY